MNRIKTLIVQSLLLSSMTAAINVFANTEVTSVVRQIPERGAVSSVLITAGNGNDASLILPPGWKAGLNQNENSLILQASDFCAYVTLRMTVDSSKKHSAKLKDQLREQAKARILDGVISDESETTIGSKTIISFGLTRTGDKESSLQSKVVFVLFEGKIVEVGMTAQADKAASSFKLINQLLISLRSE